MRSFRYLVLTASLLTCCAAVGLADEGVSAPASDTEAATHSLPDSTGASPTSGAEADSTALDRVVVTYFHKEFRCEMCLAFEANSEEALRTAFPGELADGRLVWRVLNLDDKQNTHYEDDYGLTELSLVVAGERDGVVVEWRTLPDIWGLVDDKQALIDYVTYEVGKTLDKVKYREWAGTRK